MPRLRTGHHKTKFWFLFKKILPKSLFSRTLIILVTPLICMQLVLGYVFFERHTETILRLLSNTIAGNIALIVDWVEKDTDFERVQNLAKKNLNLQISIDPHQSLTKLGLHRKSWLYQFLKEALDQKLKDSYFIRMDSNFIYISLTSSKGILKVKLSRKQLFSRTTPLVLIWTTASAFLLFLVASLFMRNQIRPIRRLAQAAESFGKGEDNITFKPEGAIEVRQAGIAFQIMRDRLRRQLSDRLEMLAGVSHDLRTPLTRMKLQLALMVDGEDKAALTQDVSTMQQMVEGFLTYARGAGDEENKRIKLLSFLQDIVEPYQQANFHLTIECSESLEVFIKPILFKRCLDNILTNAKRYATKTILQVQASDHHWQIIIDDNGPGIPAEERENVFKAFYRLDTARNLDETGVGLGLSIARDGIRIHGGQIYLRTSPQQGVRVVIQVPF